MRLLDVGCGPGTITLGLARAVAPGDAIGIDPVPGIVAEALSQDRAELEGLSFAVGDAYDLDFEDETFDVVHAHQVLQHLARPVDALREMRRVLKPNGVMAVRDADYGTMAGGPGSPELERFFILYRAVTARNGAEALAGRYLKSWFLEAGISNLQISATPRVMSAESDTRNWGYSWAERTLHSNFGRQAVEYGLATTADLEALATGWRAWADDPASFFVYTNVEVLARLA